MPAETQVAEGSTRRTSSASRASSSNAGRGSSPGGATAITAEVAKAPGVKTVQVEPATKWVVVCGQDLNIEGIRAAVAKAGHQPDL